MERKIGEIFNYNDVKLIVRGGESCSKCYFNNTPSCKKDNNITGACSRTNRTDGESIWFELKEKNMEERTIKLSFEKAKEFYNKGGEFKDLALSAYTEEELTKVELPKTWEEFCNKQPIKKGECYISDYSVITSVKRDILRSSISKNYVPSFSEAKAHLALMQLHQLRDYYRQGWKPDRCLRYSIEIQSDNPYVTAYSEVNRFLSFQTREIAEEFLNNFKDLIEKAGDLI